MIREREAKTVSGYVMLFVLLSILFLSIVWLIFSIKERAALGAILSIIMLIGDLLFFGGLFAVSPNIAMVAQLFGHYVGTAKKTGLQWMNPFCTRKAVSLRVRNFETPKLKVNDREGNPIEIATVVVWKVVETAEAVFEVDNYENFVHVQSESALRNLATTHAYDAHMDGEISLRGNTQDVADALKVEIQERLQKAGVEVIEARISHLAYAAEIASAMLQRQQASAIIAARSKIVEGAVSMVEMALAQLSIKKIVELDEERKAAMVSNLLVVLCSDRHTQPVVNTGTLYQ
jgi:regulator of protease activity HflC (stomatin/prohibitin superfamily)